MAEVAAHLLTQRRELASLVYQFNFVQHHNQIFQVATADELS
jgi:hypothetical protein